MEMSWGRSYVIGAVLMWFLFLACVTGAAYGAQVGWPAAAVFALAIVPAVTVALQFRFAYRQLASQDEFVRMLMFKRMALAAAIAITLATAWSVGELAGLPHAPAWVIYPLFWGLFGLVTPLIRSTAS